MIPVLYDKSETDFTHNGRGVLIDTVKAVVTEERNGQYELALQYPITGARYNLIGKSSIIKARANDTSDPQLFRVYKISKPINGIVTYSAAHISYDLNGLPLAGFAVENVTPQEAITQALEDTPLTNPFSAVSDIETSNSTEITTPCSVRAILGGQEGSILDTWGGEYEFDNFVIKLHSHRGANNGVVIEYGKNLSDLTHETQTEDCYTHLMPYAVYTVEEGSDQGREGEHTVYLTERIISIPGAASMGHYKALIKDFSESFGEDTPTEEALRTKATAYANSASIGAPKVNITVSFIPLWQTEEYKKIAPLERVSLCDTVTVKYSSLGVTATAKVIKTVYDSLLERYEKVTLGDVKESLTDIALHGVYNERARIKAERGRVNAENARVTAENARVTAETGRVNAESARVTAESNRVTAENGRVSSETDRNTAETARKSAENDRAAAETARANAESGRVTAETGRVNAELARVAAENARVTAENSRETKINNLLKWTTLKTTTLTEALSEVSFDLNASYDELRITIIGRMSGGNAARIFLNGNQVSYARFLYLMKDGYLISDDVISVLYYQKPRLNYAFIELAANGANNGVSDNAICCGAVNIANIQKYSSVTISGTAENTSFITGTQFIVEGRNQ